jgi:uncharacterized damage-inducible protein DinB
MNATASPVTQELLHSWDRHCTILNNLCGIIGEEESRLKAAPDRSSIGEHLCHIHEVRNYWLNQVSPQHAEPLGAVYTQQGDEWIPITDLEEIRRQLRLSGPAVREAVRALIEAGVEQVGPYTHPVQFLQHMLWHEAGHYSSIMLALHLGGKEPDEAWEEANVWGAWRTE